MNLGAEKIKSYTFVLSGFMLLCFAFFLVTVFFNTQNKHLKANVSQFVDEKANLRADYLSMMSAANLTSQADDLQMVQLPTDKVQFVKSHNTVEKKNSFKVFKNKLFKSVLDTHMIVAGY